MYPHPFEPLFTNTGVGAIEMAAPVVVASSTTTSSATALPVPGSPQLSISIENVTNGWAFCNFGDSNVGDATLSNGIGVPPGAIRVIQVLNTTTHVTTILNTGATSGNVRFTRGNGTT